MKNKNSINRVINNNTYELLFSYFDNLPENESATYENTIALKTIECFTKLKETNISNELIKIIYERKKIDLSKITYNKEIDMFEYRDSNRLITFDKLSDHLQEKDLKEELMSNKRYKKCHERSMHIAPSIKDSRIVTGYIIIGNSKRLHSIIEYDIDDKTIVLDWTSNLYIIKEQYIDLTEFREVSSFRGEKIIDDAKLIQGNIYITKKPYLTFRDELMRDIKKNLPIFGATGEGMQKNEKEEQSSQEYSR